MTLFGLLWAMLAPLSLVLAAAALAMLFKRTGLPRWGALALAAALVVGPVAYLWRQDRAGFDALCRAEGTARIIEKAQADGFLLVVAPRAWCLLHSDRNGSRWQPLRLERLEHEENGDRNRYRLCKNQPQPAHERPCR